MYRTLTDIYRAEGSEFEPYLGDLGGYLLADLPIFWLGAVIFCPFRLHWRR